MIKYKTALFLTLSEPPDKNVICELTDCNDLFMFTLAYSEPPDGFGELIRYRQELDLTAGRKNSYHGNILIDLSRWTGSENSDYLDAFLAYLYDNAEGVRYIFTVSCPECEAMENKIIDYFYTEKLSPELYSGEFLKKHITRYLHKNDRRISPKALATLCGMLETYAKKTNSRLRGIETLCDTLISDSKNIINDTTVKRLIKPEINLSSGEPASMSLFGTGSTRERM